MLHTLIVLAAAGVLGQEPAPSKTAATECAALAAMTLPDARITSAEAVAAKPDGIPVPHCKVLGVIGAEIRFQMLLPDAWNGRFLMAGNGGFAGSLDNDYSSVRRGFAFADTDTGHQGSGIQAGWAMGHPDRLANYGHVAVHRTAETAKAIVRAYYGRAAQYSYFEGCSNGGRQALMEAQRYPQDFDGLIAGDPSFGTLGHVRRTLVYQTLLSSPEYFLSSAKIALLANAVMKSCDTQDGLADGLITDPRACAFKPESLKCAGPDGPDCLTSTELETVNAIHGDLKGPFGRTLVRFP